MCVAEEQLEHASRKIRHAVVQEQNNLRAAIRGCFARAVDCWIHLNGAEFEFAAAVSSQLLAFCELRQRTQSRLETMAQQAVCVEVLLAEVSAASRSCSRCRRYRWMCSMLSGQKHRLPWVRLPMLPGRHRLLGQRRGLTRGPRREDYRHQLLLLPRLLQQGCLKLRQRHACRMMTSRQCSMLGRQPNRQSVLLVRQ